LSSAVYIDYYPTLQTNNILDFNHNYNSWTAGTDYDLQVPGANYLKGPPSHYFFHVILAVRSYLIECESYDDHETVLSLRQMSALKIQAYRVYRIEAYA